MPGLLGISDFFAIGANVEQAGEFFDVRERPSQLPVGGFELGRPLGDVAFHGIRPLALQLIHLAERRQGLFELRGLLLQFSDQDRVVFLGLCERVPTVMRALDIFVLASKFETFGVVLLEAKAAGIPVVATDINEIPEIVRNNQDGLLFPSGDVQKLASAFVNLAKNPELRRSLGQQALADVATRYSLQSVVGRLQGLYDSLCVSHGLLKQ